MSALRLTGVTVRRDGRAALAGVDLEVEVGQLVAVIGPNGAGKSTLLAVAAGLLTPDAGDVEVAGRPIAMIGRHALARARAYLPQNPRAEWPISVERVVMLGLTPELPPFGGVPAALRARIDAALAAYDLTALRDRAVTTLSGGELARAMLARATVGDPPLLIVDEPTAGLDPRHAVAAARSLRARADAGRSLVVAVHDLDLAARIADVVVALKDGRVVAAGPVAAVLTAPILSALYDVEVAVDGGNIRVGW